MYCYTNACRFLLGIKNKVHSWMGFYLYLQCLPGKMGLFDNISAKMQPTDHMSTKEIIKDQLHFDIC